jgi:hypothetical protein
MIKGSPARSSYFWMAVGFSFIAILGLIKAATLLRGNQISIWAPTLIGFLVLMVMAAVGAVRALKQARANPDETLNLRAFQKFRTYAVCAGLVAVATSLLVNFLR